MIFYCKEHILYVSNVFLPLNTGVFGRCFILVPMFGLFADVYWMGKNY